MPKVLISDKMSPLAKKVFEDRGVEVDVITGLDADGLASSTVMRSHVLTIEQTLSQSTPALLRAAPVAAFAP